MKDKTIWSIIVGIIVLSLIFNNIILIFRGNNSIADNIEINEVIEHSRGVPSIYSRAGSYIIDLNKETDRLHHNITISFETLINSRALKLTRY